MKIQLHSGGSLSSQKQYTKDVFFFYLGYH